MTICIAGRIYYTFVKIKSAKKLKTKSPQRNQELLHAHRVEHCGRLQMCVAVCLHSCMVTQRTEAKLKEFGILWCRYDFAQRSKVKVAGL